MSFGMQQQQQTLSGNPQDIEFPVPQGTDAVSSINFSPSSNLFVGTFWDNQVMCWDVQNVAGRPSAVPKSSIKQAAPILCSTWSADGSSVFTGACDNTAKMWSLATNQCQTIGQHDAPISCINYLRDRNIVVTASWDKTLKYWDTRSPQPGATVPLNERAYDMDVQYPLMVVATAERQILIFDLSRSLDRPYKTIASPLKHQTRTVAAFPDRSGFAVGTIEGRVAIHHVEANNSGKNFAFKCHREGSQMFPVNSIRFHPLGTFATSGSDGSFNFWDKDSKQRLKQFPKCQLPITCSAFNSAGNLYAYGVAYDWHQGAVYNNPFRGQTKIYLHVTPDAEIRQRKKTAGKR